MGDMKGMGGGMMEQMHGHMQTMEGAGADSLAAMLPMHRQMAANMLSQMNGDMRGMDMAGNAGWKATTDSVRQDLVRIPDMSAQELRMIPYGEQPPVQARPDRRPRSAGFVLGAFVVLDVPTRFPLAFGRRAARPREHCGQCGHAGVR